jgi:23S rRNA (guanine1835-N2)-methyltransferase
MPMLTSPFIQPHLIRQLEQQSEPLKVFNTADGYLLSHLATQSLRVNSHVLVLVLVIGLVKIMRITSNGDSFLAVHTLERKLIANSCAFDAVTVMPASEALVDPFDCVLVRALKILALL